MIEYGPDKAEHEHLLWLAKNAKAYAQCLKDLDDLKDSKDLNDE